jgi:FlaA1/EpsC-like NDP-sugar epimerase
MRNRFILAADGLAVVLSITGAFVLRFDWFVPFSATHPVSEVFQASVVAAPLVKLPLFYVFGLYARYWRYTNLADLLTVVVAVSAASVFFSIAVLAAVWAGLVGIYPRSVLSIDWMLTLLSVAGVRVAVRVLAESGVGGRRARPDRPSRRVLVAGAGEAGGLVVREIRRNPQLGLSVMGFLDDDAAKLGKRIHQVPVIGTLQELTAVVSGRQVDEVVIAMPTAPGAVVRAVSERAREAGVPARVLPGVFEIIDGVVSVNRLREVDISDLLRRRQVLPQHDTAGYLTGSVVLVSGAGGSIGSELSRQIAKAGARTIVLMGHGENSIFEITNQLLHAFPALSVHPIIADIRDEVAVERAFVAHKPSVVFHAAAHKHVPLMEAHPAEAVSNNVIGTSRLVEAALKWGVERFVLISTDKAVQPSSVMGATKRLAESIVRDAAARTGRRFMAVRFGNVLGSRGSVVPFFRKQIERGGPVTVTHPEMTRYFMTIPEAVYLVLKAGGLASGGELFVLNMGKPVKIVDLAVDLIRLTGLSEADVPIVYTGLRPGEKLHESLWEDGSTIVPIADGDVFRVQEPHPFLTSSGLAAVVDALASAVAGRNDAAIRRVLAGAIPTYVLPPDQAREFHLERAAVAAAPPPLHG